MRDYRIDNIKGILMVLVVFGHLLELSLGYGIHKELYVIIYAFHMPLFVFTTGYFAKYNLKKVFTTMILPYFIFQTLYLLFDRYALGNATQLQYTKPYWILWYLFAVIVWTLFMPLIAKCTHKGILLLLACVISLLVGYINEIGRVLSLSRIFVFLPFFLLGCFSREWKLAEKLQKKRYLKIPVCILTGISVVYCIGNADAVKIAWLYEASSYANGGYTLLFRGVHLSIAVSFLLFALLWIPNKKIRFLSKIGQRTLPIFLMHGFVIRLIGKYGLFQNIEYQTLTMLLIAVMIVLVLQSQFITHFFFPFAFSSEQERETHTGI